MVDRQGCSAFRHIGHRRQGNLYATGSGDIQAGECVGPKLERGGHFKDNSVLVALGKDGGDQALAKRVVERTVNGGHRDAHPSCRVAVNVHIGLQTLLLLVTGHIGQLWQLAQTRQQGRGGARQFVDIG